VLAWPLSLAASPFFGSLMLGSGALLRFAFSAVGFWITLVTTIFFGWLASRIPRARRSRYRHGRRWHMNRERRVSDACLPFLR
jgi:hypothetical protein